MSRESEIREEMEGAPHLTLALFHVALALQDIAYALRALGNADAATPMGAMEAHGKCVLDAADKIAAAIYETRGE